MNNFSLIQKDEFSILVKLNMKRAYFSALGILGSHDDAMDISQDAFIQAFKNFNKYDRAKPFFTWYYKILKNLCINKINRSYVKSHNFLELDENHQYSIDENAIENNEAKSIIQEALLKLEFQERELIILKEFENYTYQEISEMLDIPIGTVMSRLFYARKKLSKIVRRKYDS